MENGSTERSVDLSGDNETVTVNRSFSDERPYQIDATVVDTKGYSQTTSLLVYVSSAGGGGGRYDHCPDGGSPYFGFDGEFIGCTPDSGADMIYEDRVLEQNGEEGLDLAMGGTGMIVQMMSPEEVENFEQDSNGAPTREFVEQTHSENIRESISDDVDSYFEDALNSVSSQSSGTNNGGSSSDADSTDTSLPPIESTSPPPSTQRYLN